MYMYVWTDEKARICMCKCHCCGVKVGKRGSYNICTNPNPDSALQLHKKITTAFPFRYSWHNHACKFPYLVLYFLLNYLFTCRHLLLTRLFKLDNFEYLHVHVLFRLISLHRCDIESIQNHSRHDICHPTCSYWKTVWC
jgi:hypothetical protein